MKISSISQNFRDENESSIKRIDLAKRRKIAMEKKKWKTTRIYLKMLRNNVNFLKGLNLSFHFFIKIFYCCFIKFLFIHIPRHSYEATFQQRYEGRRGSGVEGSLE